MTHDIELRGRAYHEAGHAVVYRFFGIDVVRVSIEPDGKGHDGECTAVNPHPIEVSRQGGICQGSPFIAHRIMGILAGRVAQEMFAADSVKPHHDRYDYVNVRAWVGKYDPWHGRKSMRMRSSN